jgi:hypothetical protein
MWRTQLRKRQRDYSCGDWDVPLADYERPKFNSVVSLEGTHEHLHRHTRIAKHLW